MKKKCNAFNQGFCERAKGHKGEHWRKVKWHGGHLKSYKGINKGGANV